MYYKLEGKAPVKTTLAQWVSKFTLDFREAYAELTIGGVSVSVSTIFLGLDHNHSGPPLLFETLIFGGEHDRRRWRYCTWPEAKTRHTEVVEALQEGKVPE